MLIPTGTGRLFNLDHVVTIDRALKTSPNAQGKFDIKFNLTNGTTITLTYDTFELADAYVKTIIGKLK